MTKEKLLQRKKITNNIKARFKSLSIQFSLGGFSFCIRDDNSNQVISFAKYVFNKVTKNETDIINKLPVLFSESDLQDSFTTIKVVHKNNLSTLVPDIYFDENNLKSYLSYNVKTLLNDPIYFDNISKIATKNVYIPFIKANDFVFKRLGEFEQVHHATLLIDKLIDYNRFSVAKTMFVNVSEFCIDIVVLGGQKLLFYNSFSYETKEDFLYYILFCIEQLRLNAETLKFLFLGEISSNSELYKIVFKYVKNVGFITIGHSVFENSEFLNHSNYILVS